MTDLDVWMHGARIARLTRRGARWSLRYSEEALEHGLGLPLLSVRFPTTPQPYTGEQVQRFFDGLLPEGEARRTIAYDHGVDDSDTFGLLAAIGRDCAGALVLLESGEEPSIVGTPEPIDDEGIAQRLRDLRLHPLGIDARIRVSLAGVQEKLLLTRVGDQWCLPTDGTPSTHLLKPRHPDLPDSVTNEGFCMALTAHAGISVAAAYVHQFSPGSPVLVVSRYDRTVAGADITRIHQEDFCQAHGLGSRQKYQAAGGTTLAHCAQTLRRWSRPEDVRRLLEYQVVHVAVGNADAHAKNISLLHHPGGRVTLAPVYDLMSTTYYSEIRNMDSTPGMLINDVTDITAVTTSDVIAEAGRWGIRDADARQLVTDTLERMRDALTPTAEQTGAPEQLIELVSNRISELLR